MNTETKVHEHNMAQFEEKYGIYRNAYNAGKSDAIQAFVERVKKDIDELQEVYVEARIGYDCCIDKDAVKNIIDRRMKEVLGNEG